MWLYGFGLVVRRHNATFSWWPVAEHADHSLTRPAQEFVVRWCELVGPKLDHAGVDLDPAALATALLTTAQRAFALHARVGRDCSESHIAEAFARIFQLAMFPSSVSLFGETRLPPSRSRAGARDVAQAPPVSGRSPGWAPGLRRPVTARGQATVGRIADAAAAVFARQGLHGTSVGDIAAAAGVGHASVYTYWPDRAAVFTTLTHQAGEAVDEWLDAASLLTPGPGCAEHVLAWARRYLAGYVRQAAVLRAWAVDEPSVGEVERLRQRRVARARSVFGEIMTGSPVRGLVDLHCAEILVFSLLKEFPYDILVLIPDWPGAEAAVETISAVVSRGLLGDL